MELKKWVKMLYEYWNTLEEQKQGLCDEFFEEHLFFEKNGYGVMKKDNSSKAEYKHVDPYHLVKFLKPDYVLLNMQKSRNLMSDNPGSNTWHICLKPLIPCQIFSTNNYLKPLISCQKLKHWCYQALKF